MCGILCSILCDRNKLTTNESINHCCVDDLIPALTRRGPDSFCKESIVVSERVTCDMIGTVLWMQGTQLTSQPYRDQHGNLLLWNGEVFNHPTSWPSTEDSCDTALLSKALSTSSSPIEVFSTIQGPFAMVYLDLVRRRLWFGRDRLGRHSLLLSVHSNQLVVTSVGRQSATQLEEVSTAGLFSVDLDEGLDVTLHPWITDEIFPTMSSPSETVIAVFDPFRDACCTASDILDQLLKHDAIKRRVLRLEQLLRDAVRVRVETQPRLCQTCVANDIKQGCQHAKLAVLFSGGLDSAVLARLAHDYVPADEPIHLINVAFQKPSVRVKQRRRSGKPVPDEPVPDEYNVPDRKTGRQTLQELQDVCPNRDWQFLEVNVTQAELSAERAAVIADLIHPLHTVLDDSLGCALWFAARGVGEHCTSPARVLLLGMGADEQLGGYMRHRTSLAHGGWPTLSDQLASDVANIASRNLGRDDRIVSDHGRQGRVPYLDETVVNFLNRLAPWDKCFPVPHLPPGTGDKYLLRLVAKCLSLERAAVLPKRAMQFGSRIANSREKGSDKCGRLVHNSVMQALE